ncbi:MAG: DUF5709 domain-containing protein [Actinomycetes bacterium]
MSEPTNSGLFGDSVYQPDADAAQQGDTEPDYENALGDPDADDMLPGYSPPERPLAVTKFGTTGVEEREGETLDQRLAQEIPDDTGEDYGYDGLGDSIDTDGELVDDQVGGPRAGRLVAPDEGAHSDTEKDVVARDVGVDGGAASAEEAAMHIIEDDDARW